MPDIVVLDLHLVLVGCHVAYPLLWRLLTGDGQGAYGCLGGGGVRGVVLHLYGARERLAHLSSRTQVQVTLENVG